MSSNSIITPEARASILTLASSYAPAAPVPSEETISSFLSVFSSVVAAIGRGCSTWAGAGIVESSLIILPHLPAHFVRVLHGLEAILRAHKTSTIKSPLYMLYDIVVATNEDCSSSSSSSSESSEDSSSEDSSSESSDSSDFSEKEDGEKGDTVDADFFEYNDDDDENSQRPDESELPARKYPAKKRVRSSKRQRGPKAKRPAVAGDPAVEEASDNFDEWLISHQLIGHREQATSAIVDLARKLAGLQASGPADQQYWADLVKYINHRATSMNNESFAALFADFGEDQTPDRAYTFLTSVGMDVASMVPDMDVIETITNLTQKACCRHLIFDSK